MVKEKEVKFEDKIKELETIIGELESGEIDLDSSIEKYTRAMKLVNECDDRLKGIEEQINKIVKEDGTLENFEAAEE
jgi:exodeoxyribonuclease VII small subunit